MYKLDEKDKKILEFLGENAKLSSQQISKKTRIPITTVHNRVKKLEKEGIIKGYTTVLDDKKMGKFISAYILVKVDYAALKRMKMRQEELARKIKGLITVENLSILAAQSDMLIRVGVGSIDELNYFVINQLRNLTGVDKTETMVVLEDI